MKLVDFCVVMSAWIIFFIVLTIRSRSLPRGPVAERRRASAAGIVVQGIAFGLLWARRPGADPHAGLPAATRWTLLALSALILAASIWWVSASIATLGKQWSYVAAVRSDHALVTTGPYRLVRHPIYGGMLGMLLGTGIVMTAIPAFALSIVLFLLGTSIRVRVEEKLLRSRFGEAYVEYAARVPALLPRLRSARIPG